MSNAGGTYRVSCFGTDKLNLGPIGEKAPSIFIRRYVSRPRSTMKIDSPEITANCSIKQGMPPPGTDYMGETEGHDSVGIASKLANGLSFSRLSSSYLYMDLAQNVLRTGPLGCPVVCQFDVI